MPVRVYGHLSGFHGALTLCPSYLFHRYPLVPECLFGFTAILAAFMVLYCPETKGRPIPQRAADLDVLKANTTFCFCSSADAEEVEANGDVTPAETKEEAV